MRCPDCQQRTSTRGRCPNCRAEHNATSVDHDHDDTKTCAWCKRSSAEGHYAQTGRWLCRDCEREQLATLTDAVDPGLEAVVQWAVGGSEPEADPGALATGFETASERAIADGGGLEPPFWCPWCEAEITDETGYDHAYEHRDKAPKAVVVEELLIDAQDDAPEEVSA